MTHNSKSWSGVIVATVGSWLACAAYLSFVSPWLEGQSAAKIPELDPLGAFKSHAPGQWLSLFAEDAWQRDAQHRNIIHANNNILIFQDYQTQRDGTLKVSRLCLLIFDKKQMGGQNADLDADRFPTVIEAQDPAILTFDQSRPLMMGKYGELEQIRFSGQVQFWKQASDPSKAFFLQTRDLTVTGNSATTSQAVRFRLGESLGQATGLTLIFSNPDSVRSLRPSLTKINALTLMRLEQVNHLSLQMAARAQPESTAAHRSAEARQIEVSCQGPAEFFLTDLYANLHQQVQVRDAQSGYHLDCQLLQILFSSDSLSTPTPIPLAAGTSPKATPDPGRKPFVPPGLKPSQIFAQGLPALVRDRENQIQLEAAQLEYDPAAQQFIATGFHPNNAASFMVNRGPGQAAPARLVTLKTPEFQMKVPYLRYRAAESSRDLLPETMPVDFGQAGRKANKNLGGELGEVWAKGAGEMWYRRSPEQTPIHIQWQEQLTLSDDPELPDRKVISLYGDANLQADQQTGFAAQEIHLWLRRFADKSETDVIRFPTQAKTRYAPDLMLAQRDVHFYGDRLSGDVQQARVFFPAEQDTPSSDSGQNQNTDKQPEPNSLGSNGFGPEPGGPNPADRIGLPATNSAVQQASVVSDDRANEISAGTLSPRLSSPGFASTNLAAKNLASTRELAGKPVSEGLPVFGLPVSGLPVSGLPVSGSETRDKQVNDGSGTLVAGTSLTITLGNTAEKSTHATSALERVNSDVSTRNVANIGTRPFSATHPDGTAKLGPNQKYSIEQLDIDGKVTIVEGDFSQARPAAKREPKFRIEGQRVAGLAQGPGQFAWSIFGNGMDSVAPATANAAANTELPSANATPQDAHAVAVTPQATIASPTIHFDQAANRIWSDRSGSLSFPLSDFAMSLDSAADGDLLAPQETTQVADTGTKPPANPGRGTLVWQGSMEFDGQVFRLRDQVECDLEKLSDNGQTNRIQSYSDLLDIELTSAIDLTRPQNQRRKAELKRMILSGPVTPTSPGVRLYQTQINSQNETVAQEVIWAPLIAFDQVAGKITIPNAGQLWSVRRGKPGQKDNAKRTVQPPSIAQIDSPASSDLALSPGEGKLNYIKIDFQQRLDGDLVKGQFVFSGPVATLYGTIENWQLLGSEDRLESPMKLTCDTMTLNRWQISKTAPVETELDAAGSVHVLGQQFESLASRLKFNQSQDLLTIVGDNRSPAKFYQTNPKTGKRNHISAQKIWYRPSSRWFNCEGFKEGDLTIMAGQ